MSMQNVKMNRKIELDYLRVAATFAVIILHIASSGWYENDVNELEWKVVNFYDSVVRWGVQIFVMISGALLLNRHIDIKTIYRKYILRMVTAFVFWSSIYSIKEIILGVPLQEVIIDFIKGHYHMWFVLMIIGIYASIPFVDELIKNEELIKYYLGLSFIISFVLPEAGSIISDFAPSYVIEMSKAFDSSIANMHLHIWMGFIFYFIWGYYVYSKELEKKTRVRVYCLGIMGFLLTILLSLIVSIRNQACCGRYYSTFTINVFLEGLAVFVFFKYHRFKHEKMNFVMAKLSKYSFGAYLVHALVIESVTILGINTLVTNPMISIPLMGVIVFVVSFLTSAVLNKIPILNVNGKSSVPS